MIIDSGAEATIETSEQGVKKKRLKKSYRHPELDEKLRRQRTRREGKILQDIPKKLHIRTPKVFNVDDKTMEIEMEFIDAPKLRDVLDESNYVEHAKSIGKIVRSLHDSEIIHGDLTTSNMLFKGEIVLIDFGLSFISIKLEDRAVDLHMLKQALQAKHPSLDMWPHVRSAYKPNDDLIERLEEVESRGRNKHK